MKRFNYTVRTIIFNHIKEKYNKDFVSLKKNSRTNVGNVWTCNLTEHQIIKIGIDKMVVAIGNSIYNYTAADFNNTKEITKMIERIMN